MSYGFFADLEDVDRILSVEIWADRAALEAHMTHDHTPFLQKMAGDSNPREINQQLALIED